MAIKLGGGGGSASQVNEVVFLKNTANVITTDDGRVYLKGGVYETDLTLYPDATNERVDAGNNFNFAANMTSAHCDAMCSDGTHLYLLNSYDNKVYKYTKAGAYVAQYSISAGNGSLKAIEWDGTDFWIASSSTYIYKFDSSFNADSSNPLYNLSSRTGGSAIEGIAWDGTHFYVLDYNRQVHKMNSDWSYANVVWGVSGSTNYVDGITSDGTYIYVYRGYLYYNVIKFSNSGADLGVEFNASWGIDGVIAWDGTHFRGADPSLNTVYKMEDANGIQSISFNSANAQGNYSQYGEGQNYLRVK
jgi:hypothetical protein